MCPVGQSKRGWPLGAKTWVTSAGSIETGPSFWVRAVCRYRKPLESVSSKTQVIAPSLGTAPCSWEETRTASLSRKWVWRKERAFWVSRSLLR